MPNNTAQSSQSPSSALEGNPPATPSRSGKVKSPRKDIAASPKRPSPASAATSAEILFKEQPNPAQAPKPPFIWIDHPREQERLTGPVYAVRLGVGGADQVEISIDGGVWQSCRLTSGYRWYDWSGIQPGRHTLAARMKTPDGRWYRTPPRSCERRP
jgi:hypothetical protein